MDERVIPLFPLGALLVPGLILPLHIFEPRYRRLVQDLLDRPEEERTFGVVAIREGHEVGAQGARALYEVGTLAFLREATPYDDGRFDIVTVGTERFTLGELDESLPYLQARVRILEEAPGDGADALAAAVARSFAAYRALLTDDASTDLPADPGVLSYLVAAAVVADLPVRQEFLAAADDARRLRQEHAFLAREMAVIAAVPSVPAVELVREPQSPN